MPPKNRKSTLSSDQKKAIKDAKNVMARASREVRGILSKAHVDPLLLRCRYGRPHCPRFVPPAQAGGGCRRPRCGHALMYHLPR